MVKLPKELQNKEKSKPRRPQAVKKREGSSLGSRQMRRKMQQQGIEMDQIDAKRVIIEGVEKTLILNQPEVILMKQMGQEIYQIIGEAEEQSSVEINIDDKSEISEEADISYETTPTITENDIMLVAAQANVDIEVAKAALVDSEGDIAKAILFLKNRP
jgi:nascent polypeptide-associated complex subunit alpha